MPWRPIGISVKCGRTWALNRLRSIPRYPGASRSRMKRGSTLMLDSPSRKKCRTAQAGCKSGIGRRLHQQRAQTPQRASAAVVTEKEMTIAHHNSPTVEHIGTEVTCKPSWTPLDLRKADRLRQYRREP